MNNTREEVVKNIMRRGLLDNKYVNKVLERKAGVIYGASVNNIQHESIRNIARLSSVKVTKNEIKQMSDPKLRRFLEKLPKNDLLKMRKEINNVAIPYTINAVRNKRTINKKVNQMNKMMIEKKRMIEKKKINDKKKIATIAGLRKAAGGRSNLVNAYSKYLKSNK